VEATERLVNLALFLVSSPRPVTAQECRAEVAGYPPNQDESAFLRMFERDKEELRAAGLAIESVNPGAGSEAYAVDRNSTHVRPADFTPEEEATLRVAAAALAADPSFPFAEDLRLALAKTLPEVDRTCTVPVGSPLAEEDPRAQGALAGALAGASASGKRVSFGYTNARGVSARREVEPYGMFLREGRWYLVGRDSARDDVRTFALIRIRDLEVNRARPKSRDFEPPAAFDVSAFVLLPFQYGEGETREALIQLDSRASFRADALTAGVGELQSAENGALRWRVEYRDGDALVRWLVANGPGLLPLEPADLAARLDAGLATAEACHAT